MRQLLPSMVLLVIALVRTGATKADIVDVKGAMAATTKFNELIVKVELKAKELKLENTKFWADKVGDLSRDLMDVLDEAGGKGADHEIHKLFRELHGSYLNLRATVKHLPNTDVRRTILKGTLDQYYEVYGRLYGAAGGKPTKPLVAKEGQSVVDDSDSDGLPQPLVDGELDGEEKTIKHDRKRGEFMAIPKASTK